MKLLRKILRKLYHLIAFLGLFMLFLTDVNADVNTFSFSNIKYYDKNGQKNPTTYTSTTTNTLYYGLNMTSSKFTITFDNNLTNYDEIGFELYNNFSQVSSNPNYDAPIMPLIVLDGYPCTVTPIGIMDQDQTYFYNGDEFALCSVKQKTGSHYIDIFTYKPSSTGNLFVGIHRDYVKGYNNEASLKDVLEQQQQTQQAITDAQQETNDTLKDESSATVDLSDVSLTSTTPISDLLTLPLSLMNSYLTAFSGSCTNYTLPLPFNHSVTLTCFTLSDVIGSNVAYIVDMAICLFMSYEIILLFIKIFEDMTSLSDTYTNWVKRGRY